MGKGFSISLNFEKMQNKTQWYVTAHQLEMLKWKWLIIPSTGEAMEQMEFSYFSDGNAKMA